MTDWLSPALSFFTELDKTRPEEDLSIGIDGRK